MTQYVVMKDGMFYADEVGSFTPDFRRAWRVSRRVAKRHESKDPYDPVTIHPVFEFERLIGGRENMSSDSTSQDVRTVIETTESAHENDEATLYLVVKARPSDFEQIKDGIQSYGEVVSAVAKFKNPVVKLDW